MVHHIAYGVKDHMRQMSKRINVNSIQNNFPCYLSLFDQIPEMHYNTINYIVQHVKCYGNEAS